MVKTRVTETNEGIQNESTVEIFDVFARGMRDKGWNNVDVMIAAGIQKGNILEVGSGPGYVGLELYKKVQPTSLIGCEISPAMIRCAEKNAKEYGVDAKYIQANCMHMPFKDGSFDAVISNGSLHEWENPIPAFDEIYRVLRVGGKYCITDLCRDVSPIKKAMVYLSIKPKQMRSGFMTSLNAAYTLPEIMELLHNSALCDAKVTKDYFGLCITGEKH